MTIRNRGQDAFKYETYGDKIVIERRLHADGGGSWKTKSANGNAISNKREEVDAICDHCHIQVDNPLNVLSQDASRQFLGSSDAREKYSFFLRGTQLTQLSQEHDIIKSNVDRMSKVVQRKRELLPELEARARDSATRYEMLDKATQQHSKLRSLKGLLVWAQVADEEEVSPKRGQPLGYEDRNKYHSNQLAHLFFSQQSLARAAEKVEQRKVKCDKITEALRRSEIDCQKAEEGVTQTEGRLESIMDRNDPLQQELSQITVRTKAAAAAKREFKKEQELLNEQYRRKKGEMTDLQGRIDEEMRKGADGERRERLNQERKKLQTDCKDIAKKEREARDQVEDLDTQVSTLGETLNTIHLRQEELQTNLAQLDALLSQLRASKANRLSAYGANIPKLIWMIKQYKGWKKEPVGPVGSHIKLKDISFGPLLESVIGNTLSAFCVTNHQDRAVLEDLRRRSDCGHVPVLMGSDEAFDWSAGEPDGGIDTILRVLDFDDAFVKRQLINNMHIERCAIVSKREGGDALMRSNPANVRVCFTLDFFRVDGGNTGSHSQTLNRYQGAPRLSSNVDDKIAETLERRNLIEKELQDAFAETRTLDAKRRSLEEERKKIKVLYDPLAISLAVKRLTS